MNAETNVLKMRDYSRAQTHAEWLRDTRLRDIRQKYARLSARLTAKQGMEESRVRAEFLSGQYDR